ncbi:MAG: pyridoxamine 5'-phosphate oxidase family protein [Gemmatimonadaceae bacterium]
MRTPTYRDLTHEECLAVLDRNHYGRLAFSEQDRVDVEPLHYVHEGDWLYMRTGVATKVATLRRHPWVAFEVDEVRAPFDWTSVVVKGTMYFLSDGPSAAEREAYQQGLIALRKLGGAGDSGEPADPSPERNVVLRMSLNELQGRAAHYPR